MKRLLAWMPIACAAAFPLHPRATTPVLIAWMLIITWGALARWPQVPRPRSTPWWRGGVAYYGLIGLGMLWSNDLDAGWFALEVKVSLLLMPLIWGATRRWVDVDAQSVMRGLHFGLGGAAVLGLSDALWESAVMGDHSGWRYAELAGALHPTYAAWYWVFGAAAWLQQEHGKRAAWGAGVAGVMLGLLASKAGWVAGVAVFGVALLQARRRRAAVLGLSGLLLAGALVGQGRALEWLEGMGQIHPASSPSHSITDPPAAKAGSTAGRVQAWSASWDVLKAHPFGVGTGDVGQELQARYCASGNLYAASHQMNAHNAYLEAAVAFGWPGLVLLVVWWAGALVAALRDRAELAATFVVLAAWFACTESVFELQSGVVWLAFGFGIWAQKSKASGDPSLPIP